MASIREVLNSGNRRSQNLSATKRVHFGPRHDTAEVSHACPICGARSGQPCVSTKSAGIRLAAAHAGRVAAPQFMANPGSHAEKFASLVAYARLPLLVLLNYCRYFSTTDSG